MQYYVIDLVCITRDTEGQSDYLFPIYLFQMYPNTNS